MSRKKIRTIRLEIYPPHDMAFVYLSGKINYIGNYSDFYPGCHGINNIGNFSSPIGYVRALTEKLWKDGLEVHNIYNILTDAEYSRKSF